MYTWDESSHGKERSRDVLHDVGGPQKHDAEQKSDTKLTHREVSRTGKCRGTGRGEAGGDSLVGSGFLWVMGVFSNSTEVVAAQCYECTEHTEPSTLKE